MGRGVRFDTDSQSSKSLMVPARTGLLTAGGLFNRESESLARCSWGEGRNVHVYRCGFVGAV